MTSPKRGLHPASCNDRWTPLRTLEFVSSSFVQRTQVVRAEVGQRVSLEPCPKIFDRVQIGSVRWKKGNLDMPVQRVEVIANHSAVMWPWRGIWTAEHIQQFRLRPDTALRAAGAG